jgi:hypothetical protein
MRVARLPDQEAPGAMDLEPGVTLAPWPMGGAPPIGSRGSIGDEPLSDSLRASKDHLTAVPTSVAAG